MLQIARLISGEALSTKDFQQFDSLVAPFLGDADNIALNLRGFNPARLVAQKKGFYTATIVIRYDLDDAGVVTSAKVESSSDEAIDKSKLVEQFMTTEHQPQVRDGHRAATAGAQVTVNLEIFRNAGLEKVQYEWSN